MQQQIEELTEAVARDPGGRDFAVLAELHRRAGRAEMARSVADSGLQHAPDCGHGRAALALALLDLGEVMEARAELLALVPQVPDLARTPASADARGWSPPPPPARAETLDFDAALGDEEIEAAFDRAETRRDEMVDVNRVAERVLEDEAPDLDGSFADEHPDFATETMADLLEEQGDATAASSIRSALHSRATPADAGGAREAESIGPSAAAPWAEPARPGPKALATLERWLQNLRGEVA